MKMYFFLENYSSSQIGAISAFGAVAVAGVAGTATALRVITAPIFELKTSLFIIDLAITMIIYLSIKIKTVFQKLENNFSKSSISLNSPIL